jgi:predicted MFS family arabinose efflux permease
MGAVRAVVADIRQLASGRGGLLAALLCFLPIGTGAGQGVLTQATVAGVWGASDNEVAMVQGVLAGVVTAAGCFAGGWVCDRLQPRTAYAVIGLMLAAVGAAMGLCAPGSVLNPSGVSPVTLYVVGNLTYAFVVGLAYAAFTAVVLQAIGRTSAATKYSLYASLSNFPIWWLGLLLGRAADQYGAANMLYVEAVLGVLGVLVFAAVGKAWRNREEPPTAAVV